MWRDPETVQIGIDPRRAVALTGMGRAAAVLGLLDGSRDRAQVVAAAAEQGVPEAVTDRILTLLAAGGALDDVTGPGPAAVDRRALACELAAAALARGHSDAGSAALARRQATLVRIYGPGRVAAAIAGILSTSGVSQVTIADLVRSPAPVARARLVPETSGTAVPGGTDPGRVSPAGRAGHGKGRQTAARPAVPDLAVLVGYPDPELAGWLMRGGVPHLAVTADEAIGVVGPLVRPGRTACLRCVNLTRAALDPAWPLILAQLAGRRAEPAACDAALAAAVAAQAAVQALAVIDREPGPAAAENGTLELVMPGWQWRRRTWPAHDGCGCSRHSPR